MILSMTNTDLSQIMISHRNNIGIGTVNRFPCRFLCFDDNLICYHERSQVAFEKSNEVFSMKKYVKASNYRVYNEDNGRYYTIDPNDPRSLAEMLEDVGGRDFANQVISIMNRALVSRDEVNTIIDDTLETLDEVTEIITKIERRDDVDADIRDSLNHAENYWVDGLRFILKDFKHDISMRESWG